MLDGVTPFPAEFAARYRALGYWQDRPLFDGTNSVTITPSWTSSSTPTRNASSAYKPAMATLDDVRRIAMSLPRTTEHLIGDNTKFRVGRLVYASVSADEERLGFGFPKEERAALVASEPDKFMMPLRGDERYQWVRARLPVLDATELRELLIDAWCMVVPKTIAARYLESQGLEH
jgi:hypothetical protein